MEWTTKGIIRASGSRKQERRGGERKSVLRPLTKTFDGFA
jgi:hypothetical protein